MLVSEDVGWLVAQTPTPLGWLAEPEEAPVEQPATLDLLDEQLLSGVLSPEDLRWVAPALDAESLRSEWSAENGLDPEFFGDSILNNTSIVLWIDAPGQSRRYRVLLTGDQENWTYLLLKHPFGMQADLLKAPHHGGSLYIESTCAPQKIKNQHSIAINSVTSPKVLAARIFLRTTRGKPSCPADLHGRLPPSLGRLLCRSCCWALATSPLQE